MNFFNSYLFLFSKFRYKGVEINDFTRSWQDGLAFNALIHKFHPELFDYEEILQNTTARNLEHAFSVAKNVFKIDRYLDVEGSNFLLFLLLQFTFLYLDFLSDIPDKKSLLMYVMCLFQQLPSSNIIIEDKEKTTTDDDTMETKVKIKTFEIYSEDQTNFAYRLHQKVILWNYLLIKQIWKEYLNGFLNSKMNLIYAKISIQMISKVSKNTSKIMK